MRTCVVAANSGALISLQNRKTFEHLISRGAFQRLLNFLVGPSPNSVSKMADDYMP